jgi:hypothetical protein
MIRVLALVLLACAVAYGTEQPARRVVILKIDGLNADLLYRNMREKDPSTRKPRLPWFSHIFGDNGTVFENFWHARHKFVSALLVHLGYGPPYHHSR